MTTCPSARHRFAAIGIVTMSLLVGCGGGDDATAPMAAAPVPAAPIAPTQIGAAGGTVTGEAGSQVMVPAGALAVATTIAIQRSSLGAPALPSGFAAGGDVFALTPHGTTFAVPVTVTVPVDAARLPAGRAGSLYKTNAAGAWERVTTTVNAGFATAQVTGFSWLGFGAGPPVAGQWQALGGALDSFAGSRSDAPAVALDLAGHPVVAWAEYGDIASGAGIRVKRWNGVGWVAPGASLWVPNGPFPQNFQSPSIAIDPVTGHPAVAWSQSKTGQGAVQLDWEVVVKRWNGTAWQLLGTPLNVTAAEGARYPTIRFSAAGPVVAWWETPHFTYAKRWNGAAWVAIGGQNVVGPQVTGAQSAIAALAIDAGGEPLVLHGGATGALAAKSSSSGWSYVGFFVNEPAGQPLSWGVAYDDVARPLALIASTASVDARRFDNGVWSPMGAGLFTATASQQPFGADIHVPHGTAAVLASWYVLTRAVGLPTTAVHSFRQWDGAGWVPLAPDLPHYCAVAARDTAAITLTATVAAACVQGAGAAQDIVVFQLVP